MNINATIIGQAIVFLILIWFSVKFIWPPLLKAIEDRQKKIADGLAAAERGQKELHQASGEVHGRLRVSGQEFGDTIDIPSQRREMHTDEFHPRKALQQAIARGQLLVVRRPFRVPEHVVLRMLRKVVPVAAYGHLVQRQPGVARLALMTKHYYASRHQ